MVTVETYGMNGETAAVTQATRVLVKDAHGNAIILAVEYEETDNTSVVLVSSINDSDFRQLLATFGVSKVAVVGAVIEVGRPA